MVREHRPGHVLRHAGGQPRLDHAQDRNIFRELGIAEDVIDPGADGDHQLQAPIARQLTRRRRPDERHLDRTRVTLIRPIEDLQVRVGRRQGRMPNLVLIGKLGLEEKSHGTSL